MVTGASTADLALVLVDARKGLVEQSRRHAFLATLLQVPHLVLVRQQDGPGRLLPGGLRGDPRRVHAASPPSCDVPDLTVIPVSALNGDNVVTRSENMPWYEGPSLLHHLENVHVASDRNLIDVRFPVQYVIRPQSDALARLPRVRRAGRRRRAQEGRRGDGAAVGLHLARSRSVETADGPVDEAYPPMSVTVRLEDEIDVSRGDMICRPNNQPTVAQDVDAMICWMDERLRCGRAASTRSSTPRGRPARWSRTLQLPARRQHAAPRRGAQTSWRSTRSAGSGCARRVPLHVRRLLPQPHDRAASSSSTRRPTAPSPPA